MNQCHRVFTVGYVVPRGSIFRQRLSEKIFQLAAAGLIDKAFGDVYDGVALLAAERGVQVSAPVKLGLFHLQASIYPEYYKIDYILWQLVFIWFSLF